MRMRCAMAPGAVAVALTIMPVMSARALEPPKGWLQAGMNPDDYEMAVDPKGGRSG